MQGRKKKILGVSTVAAALVLVGLMIVPTLAAPSGVTWGPARRGTASNAGYFMANSSQSTDFSVDGGGPTTYNYSIYYQDFDYEGGTGYAWPYCANGKPTQDPNDCPWQVAVYVERSANGGATWTDRKLVNDFNDDNMPDEDGERVSICADGANVYAAWATQKEFYSSKVGSGPRAVRFRSNTNFAASGSWNAAQALTPLNSQADYPSMACANGRIYVAYTDSKTGKLHVQTSTDAGGTWTDQMIGRTKAILKGPYPHGPGGYGGRPIVVTSDDGMTIGVAWFAPEKSTNINPGKIMARTSNDGGATWDAAVTLANTSGNSKGGYVGRLSPGGSGATDRIAFAWADKNRQKGFVREFTEAGGWQAKTLFAQMPDMVNGTKGIFGPGVGLEGTTKTAVSFGGCYDDPCKNYKGSGIPLFYTQSTDNGATWSDIEMIGTGGVDGSTFFDNYAATIVFNGSTTRYVMWQGMSKNWWNYERRFRVGTGG